MVRDYDRLKKVRGPKHKRSKNGLTDKQYNVVEIAKAAATASGGSGADAETGAGADSADGVQNRAGKVEATEKRKADTLEGDGAMDVGAGDDEAVAVEGGDSDAAPAAKQQKI